MNHSSIEASVFNFHFNGQLGKKTKTKKFHVQKSNLILKEKCVNLEYKYFSCELSILALTKHSFKIQIVPVSIPPIKSTIINKNDKMLNYLHMKR